MSPRKLGRTCSSCGIGIIDDSTTGQCRPCWCRAYNSDAENMRRRGERQSEILRTDPEAYARKCATIAKNREKAFANPFFMAKLRAHGRHLKSLRTPEAEARRAASVIAANKRRRHAWLPDAYRDEYVRMIQNRRFKAKEAKRIILDQIAADARRSGNGDERETINTITEAATGSARLLEAMRSMAQ